MIELLVENSNLEFTTWSKQQYVNKDIKWAAHTPIDRFGAYSKEGEKNDIGYQLFGSGKDYVNELQLVLNVYNAEDKENALTHLAILSEQVLLKLGIELPKDLKEQIVADKHYFLEMDSNYILVRKINDTDRKIEITKMSILSK